MMASNETYVSSLPSDTIDSCVQLFLNGTSQITNAEKVTANIVFWLCVSICIVIGILSSFGNGLVVYVSYKKEDFGGFRHVNSVVKNLAFSDCLFGLIGCPLTIVFWYWGEFGELERQFCTVEEWKAAIVRLCYVTFQNASCYFVFLIVLLRISIVQNPFGSNTFLTKSIKPICATIWCMCFLLNTIPLVTTSLGHNGRSMDQYMNDLMTCYFTVLHVGITIPLSLTIIANIYLSCKLKNMSTPKRDSKRSSKETKNSRTFQKFLNGLVIWLVICNAPYIAWYIWSLTLYANNGGKAWAGVEGVLFTAIARLLVTFNSSVNPWVYATTVPDFKKTVRRLLRRKTGLNLFGTTSQSGQFDSGIGSKNSRKISTASKKTSTNAPPDRRLLKADSVLSNKSVNLE